MKILGYLLFTVGIMIAVAAGAKLPPPVEEVPFRDLLQQLQSDPESDQAAIIQDLRIGSTRIAFRKSTDDSVEPLFVVDLEPVTERELESLVTLLTDREIPFQVTETVRVPRFPDTWPFCLFGVLSAIAGVVLWRAAARADRVETVSDNKHGVPRASPHELLLDALRMAQKLEAEIADLKAETILPRLDEVLEQYIHPFVGMRQRVLDHFGMAVGAEILVATSVGERMLNRTWSAAADGYLAEARSSFSEAVRALEEAQQRWKQAELASPKSSHAALSSTIDS